MSNFSDTCKQILNENGTNVYRLSKEYDLECTTLQRMVTGKRLPGIEFIRSFCKALRIPESQKKHLMELYKIEAIGENVYKNRMCIQKLLRRLKINEGGTAVPVQAYAPVLSDVILQDTHNKIYSLLEGAFQKETGGEVYTNFPVTDEYLFNTLLSLYKQYQQTIHMQHMINFRIDSNDSHHNLNILYHILPFALSEKLDYSACYCYSRLSEFDYQQILFPYYLISNDQVLLLSNDLQKYLLLTEPSMVSLYKKEFYKLTQQCSPLIQVAESLDHAWNQYKEIHTKQTQNLYILEPTICCWDMMEIEDINGLLDSGLTNIPVHSDDIMTFMAKAMRNKTAFFTEEGVRCFCETGRFQGQIGIFFPPVPLEERIRYLNQYLDHETNSYLLKDELAIPATINIEISSGKQISFIIMTLERIRFFSIDESSICDAFYDFAKSLHESELAENKEATKKFIREQMEKLKQKLVNN